MMNTRRYFLFVIILAVTRTTMAQTGADALASLKINPTDAAGAALDMLRTGSAYHQQAFETFKALAAGDRAAVVKSGLAWIRSYTASSAFASEYAAFRDGHKPELPEAVPTLEEYFARQKKDLEAQAAESRKTMEAVDSETKKAMEAAYKQMRDQILSMEKDADQRNIIAEILEMQRAERQNQYTEKLAAWNRDFPEDPETLISARIREFLEMSADVDFSAKLVDNNGILIFENEDYEARSQDWKLCYRAGKEATAAARAFLEKWLGELEGE
jgi:flagellar biosynthesis GTPase FlhF